MASPSTIGIHSEVNILEGPSGETSSSSIHKRARPSYQETGKAFSALQPPIKTTSRRLFTLHTLRPDMKAEISQATQGALTNSNSKGLDICRTPTPPAKERYPSITELSINVSRTHRHTRAHWCNGRVTAKEGRCWNEIRP